jgi:hypothetical protein
MITPIQLLQRDAGVGFVTRWETAPGRLAVECQGPAERVVVLGQGFENHLGMCALARIDLADPGEELRWGIRIMK